ncbi:MAG: hypothetical protein MUC43_13520 [Pirellula sp.]|jgi:hypothetical protein|nr:hypothetical protein [Pirellula sp.]
MFATLDRLERLLEIVQREGIQVRRDWLRGVRGGLVRIGRQPVLFLDESLSIPEQYCHVREALSQLDWTETEYGDEMAKLLENSPI